ncbi:MAG: hypothetical protein ABSA29_10585 [Terriglobales bacterium]|jgi:hypothetical protein
MATELFRRPCRGDFDNDGNLDLAVTIASAGSTFAFVTILPGNGDGTFA